jgi:hypothetical protein
MKCMSNDGLVTRNVPCCRHRKGGRWEEGGRSNGEEIVDGMGCRREDHGWVHQSKLGCLSGHLAGRHDWEGELSRCEATAVHVSTTNFFIC